MLHYVKMWYLHCLMYSRRRNRVTRMRGKKNSFDESCIPTEKETIVTPPPVTKTALLTNFFISLSICKIQLFPSASFLFLLSLFLSLCRQFTDYICAFITQLYFPLLSWNCVLLFAIIRLYYRSSQTVSTGCSVWSSALLVVRLSCYRSLLTWEIPGSHHRY